MKALRNQVCLRQFPTEKPQETQLQSPQLLLGKRPGGVLCGHAGEGMEQWESRLTDSPP